VPTTDRAASPGRVDRFLNRFRTTPAGRLTVKIVIGAAGFVVIATGIVLLPLPGPGWLIIFAGLAIWSLEFHWARKLNAFARGKVWSWTEWLKKQPLSVRAALALATVLFVLAVVGVSLRMTFGPGIFARIADRF
jgi:uncharacterized protein (TIGR02611 family)